jgi:uncharacterized protein YndB with AHSA1/START domain
MVGTAPETGTLVLADLTGYTAYLAGGEIEHAPTIAGDLLETVIGRLEPPFRLAKLEGDAAFLYVEDGRADGSLQLDALEAAFFAFRRRLRSIDQASSCDCAACSLAPRLDLKLFVHHGTWVRSRIAGRDELAGSDVILAHRLLKGSVSETRRAGFVQLTAAASDALGLDTDAAGLTAATESFDHIGEVQTRVLDLDARWSSETGTRRLELDPGTSFLDLALDIPAEPATVWAHLTTPALRAGWEGPITISEDTVGGRRGLGTTTRCVTGRLTTLEEVVDWQPFDHVAWRLAVPGIGPLVATADLEPGEGTTRLRLRWATADRPPAAEAVMTFAGERRAAILRLEAGLGSSSAR